MAFSNSTGHPSSTWPADHSTDCVVEGIDQVHYREHDGSLESAVVIGPSTRRRLEQQPAASFQHRRGRCFTNTRAPRHRARAAPQLPLRSSRTRKHQPKRRCPVSDKPGADKLLGQAPCGTRGFTRSRASGSLASNCRPARWCLRRSHASGEPRGSSEAEASFGRMQRSARAADPSVRATRA
jgi:hypothetical protein